jgi:hypothetical protein
MRGVHQVVLGLVILAGSPKQAEPQVDDREARGGNEHHEQVCWPAAWQHPYNGQPDEAENAGHGDEDAKNSLPNGGEIENNQELSMCWRRLITWLVSAILLATT